MEIICTSCKIKITNDTKSTKFKCPECGNLIVRCNKCRILAIEWKCPNCGYTGP